MLKTFFHLLIVIILPLCYLLIATPYNPINAINQWFMNDRVINSYKGTLYLIEKQLQSIPQSTWEKEFTKISEKFPYPLTLIHIDSTQHASLKLSDLEQNEYQFFNNENDNEGIVKRVRNSDWVVYMMLEESDDQETLNLSQGTYHLLSDHLKEIEPNQWHAALQRIEPQFGFELKLLEHEALSLAEDKKTQLQDMGRTWINTDENETLIYLKILDNQKIIEAGPIPLPGPRFTLIVTVVILMLGVISVGILLFVLPLWWDLKKLSQSASLFGEGHLNKRVAIGKGSSISSLANSFNIMADRIETMVKGQRELTNAIAHDLRTPLSRLSFAFEMLESQDITHQDRLRYERSIAMGIDTLDHLIQQILTLSRYSRVADITHFKHCKLAPLLKEEFFLHQEKQTELSFELNIEADLSEREIFVDQRAIIRAANNLLVNAEQHATKTLRLGLFQQEDEYVLSVEDDGPGIPDTEWEHIFLPFKQLNNDQRETAKGHGLGLAIVKQIAEWHNGTVSLGTSSLGGARFEIHWPITSTVL